MEKHRKGGAHMEILFSLHVAPEELQSILRILQVFTTAIVVRVTYVIVVRLKIALKIKIG